MTQEKKLSSYIMIMLKLNLKLGGKPKQMIQRLPIALAQVKAGKTSASLLNKT